MLAGEAACTLRGPLPIPHHAPPMQEAPPDGERGRLRAATPLVAQLFDTHQVTDADGQVRTVDSEIGEALADALYRTVLARRPRLVVEIGMANGVSSLAILSALRDAERSGSAAGARLISIDPFQHAQWHGVGLTNVARAGLGGAHQLLEQPDYLALPDLLRAGTRVDFAYIDGWHTFDYTLLDFWYVDKMLHAGGVVAFNDCGWRAVHKAIRFVQTHRRYAELDVGLPKNYAAGDPLRTLVRRAMRWNTNDRYFEKREDWEPSWNFYVPF
ncbi:hypothetical protein tb265_02670 [Gemmatimonadetes bacterium T265]|nr:hypothetical protein tb265_02670 [Gemmatimonadetes bacterium T265]